MLSVVETPAHVAIAVDRVWLAMSDERWPSVDGLAQGLEDVDLPRPMAVRKARETIHHARERDQPTSTAELASHANQLAATLAASRSRRVVNATGVLLHTNLGRSPWLDEAVALASRTASGFSNLELDTSTGNRGRRGSYVTELVCELTGAEGALIVNNNAAALFLVLSALALDQSVVVSRGELIEIGGSYRLPDLMAASGAHMVEVGTTNSRHSSSLSLGAIRTVGMKRNVADSQSIWASPGQLCPAAEMFRS